MSTGHFHFNKAGGSLNFTYPAQSDPAHWRMRHDVWIWYGNWSAPFTHESNVAKLVSGVKRVVVRGHEPPLARVHFRFLMLFCIRNSPSLHSWQTGIFICALPNVHQSFFLFWCHWQNMLISVWPTTEALLEREPLYHNSSTVCVWLFVFPGLHCKFINILYF